MADLLPDIPADLWNQWSATQFASAAQEKIAGLDDEINQHVQTLLPPPLKLPRHLRHLNRHNAGACSPTT